jgi:hypothetical protein
MPRLKCKSSETLRKAYTRKNGTKVKQKCVKKRSPNKVKVKKSIIKKFKPMILSLKKDELKKYGYKNIKTLGIRKRRQSLAKAINNYGAKKVFSKLGAVKTLHKNKNVDLARKYLNNMVWLRKKFDKEFKGSYKNSALFKHKQ